MFSDLDIWILIKTNAALVKLELVENVTWPIDLSCIWFIPFLNLLGFVHYETTGAIEVFIMFWNKNDKYLVQTGNSMITFWYFIFKKICILFSLFNSTNYQIQNSQKKKNNSRNRIEHFKDPFGLIIWSCKNRAL